MKKMFSLATLKNVAVVGKIALTSIFVAFSIVFILWAAAAAEIPM